MLKPRDAPDVVRSTYAGEGEQRRPGGGGDYSIDNLFGVPAKISIPERYVPEQVFSRSKFMAMYNFGCFHIEVIFRGHKL
jgi:hypothetical protein